MTAIPNLNILLYNSCGIVWSPQFLILYKVSPVNGYQEGSGGGSLGALGATIHLKGNISERNAPDQASLFCLTYSVKLDNVRKLVLTECLFSSVPMHLSIHVFMYVYKAFQSCLEKGSPSFRMRTTGGAGPMPPPYCQWAGANASSGSTINRTIMLFLMCATLPPVPDIFFQRIGTPHKTDTGTVCQNPFEDTSTSVTVAPCTLTPKVILTKKLTRM